MDDGETIEYRTGFESVAGFDQMQAEAIQTIREADSFVLLAWKTSNPTGTTRDVNEEVICAVCPSLLKMAHRASVALRVEITKMIVRTAIFLQENEEEP